MNAQRKRLLALYLAVALTLPLVGAPFAAPMVGTVQGETLHAGNSAGFVGASPSVAMPLDPVIDDTSDSDLTVHYDVSSEGVAADKIQVVLVDANEGSMLDSTGVTSKSGDATLTVAGNDVSGDFTAQVRVLDTSTSPNTELATDTVPVAVRNPGPSNGVDIVDETFTAGQKHYVDVGYNLTGTTAGGDTNNVNVVLVNTDTSSDVATSPIPGPKGAVTLEFTASETFNARVEVRHNGSPVATDTATYTAGGGGGGGGGGGEWLGMGCWGPSNGNPGACIDLDDHIVQDGTQLTFDASRTEDDGTIVSYDWDFDDSGSTDATGEVVTHTYPSTGKYTARLTVTDNDGNTNTVTVPVDVQSTWPATGTDLSVTTTNIENGSATASDREITINYDAGTFNGNAEIMVASMGNEFNAIRTTVSSAGNTATVELPQFSPSSQPTFILFMDGSHTFGYADMDEELAFSTACFDLEDASGSAYFDCPSVTSSEVTTADGQSLSDVSVDASLGDFGMVDVTLHETGTPSNLDLASGTISDDIDADTPLWVNYTVQGAHPGALVGRADTQSWSVRNVTTGSTIEYEVNVSLTPIEMYRNTAISVPDPNRWPTTDGKANRVDHALVDFSMTDLSMLPAEAREGFQGATLTTDAQVYRPPQYSPGGNGQTGRLSFDVAGPHYETDGSTQNTGFYEAIIPAGMLEAWGADASQLEGKYQGQSLDALEVTELDDGNVHVRTDVHYSNGTITLAPTGEVDDSAGGGGDGGSSATATPTPTATPTSTPAEASTATPTATATAEQTATAAPTATADSTPAAGTPRGTSETGPGFGPLAALAAILIGLATLRRRA